jgi:hypothetical protein
MRLVLNRLARDAVHDVCHGNSFAVLHHSTQKVNDGELASLSCSIIDHVWTYSVLPVIDSFFTACEKVLYRFDLCAQRPETKARNGIDLAAPQNSSLARKRAVWSIGSCIFKMNILQWRQIVLLVVGDFLIGCSKGGNSPLDLFFSRFISWPCIANVGGKPVKVGFAANKRSRYNTSTDEERDAHFQLCAQR